MTRGPLLERHQIDFLILEQGRFFLIMLVLGVWFNDVPVSARMASSVGLVTMACGFAIWQWTGKRSRGENAGFVLWIITVALATAFLAGVIHWWAFFITSALLGWSRDELARLNWILGDPSQPDEPTDPSLVQAKSITVVAKETSEST